MFTERLARNKDLLFLLAVALLAAGAYAAWYFRQDVTLTIHWTTENELDVLGFNLYRAEAVDGDYRKLNDQLIPSAADPVRGSQYRFVDHDVVAGQTYYYVLETIDRNGNVNRRQPVTIPAR